MNTYEANPPRDKLFNKGADVTAPQPIEIGGYVYQTMPRV